MVSNSIKSNEAEAQNILRGQEWARRSRTTRSGVTKSRKARLTFDRKEPPWKIVSSRRS
jgi:hypothetical protein